MLFKVLRPRSHSKLSACCILNEMPPIVLSTWILGPWLMASTLWTALEYVTFPEEVHYNRGQALKFQKLHTIPSMFSLIMVQNISFSLLLGTPCLHSACRHGLKSSGIRSPNKLFYTFTWPLNLNHSNRNVTNTEAGTWSEISKRYQKESKSLNMLFWHNMNDVRTLD